MQAVTNGAGLVIVSAPLGKEQEVRIQYTFSDHRVIMASLKTCLLTGGNTGIGFNFAQKLLAKGAVVRFFFAFLAFSIPPQGLCG